MLMDWIVGITIAGLIFIIVTDRIALLKERRDWMKYSKAESVSELEYVFPGKKEEEPKEEVRRFVPLEEIPNGEEK